jgi:hypothetical protein
MVGPGDDSRAVERKRAAELPPSGPSGDHAARTEEVVLQERSLAPPERLVPPLERGRCLDFGHFGGLVRAAVLDGARAGLHEPLENHQTLTGRTPKERV